MFVNRDNYINYLKLWLIVMFLLIVSMVTVGGLTRLTESGLSITAWELFSGILPPFTLNEWNYYFSEYKKIPEYRNINYDMTLTEFKVIFYWEYAHRLLARIVGLFSIFPLIYFSLKFKFNKYYSNKYYIIFFLVCLQGFIGWYMVSSGLVENNDVSHFRLSVHLSLALFLLCLIFWFLLELMNIDNYKFKISNSFLITIFALLIIQIILGSFLSGLNGGLIYNTWPDMNGFFFPDDITTKDFISSELFYNSSIIQFFHRLIAYIIIFFILILNYLFIKKKLNFADILIFDFAIFLQVFLGIITLITNVEIKYASLHQLGSIFVLSSYLIILFKNTN